MKTIINLKSIVILIVTIVLSFSVSCKQGKKSSNENGTLVSTGIDKTHIEREVREFVYPLPTSFEITEMLQRINAAFILTITNPVSNFDRYLTDSKKAINLGIYGADLSYVATYNQKQEIVNYMNVCKNIIDAMNITGALSTDIIEKVEQNQDDKDFLVELITNTFFDTYEILNQGGRGYSSMLVIAGSWIEALYIATNITKSTFENKEMVQTIAAQKVSLEKLISLMETMTDESVVEVTKQLLPIRNIYNTIGENMTIEQLESLTKEISAVRAQMIQ